METSRKMFNTKSTLVPETVLDTAVVEVPQRRKSSFSITVDSATLLKQFSQRRQSTKDRRQEELAGKRILFVCCGHAGLDSKRFAFERAKTLGVRSFLVEDGTNTLAVSMKADDVIEELIAVDMKPRPCLLADVLAKLAPIQARIGKFDGVCTLWDDAVALGARVSAALGLPGSLPDSIDIAHDKHLTREAMRKAQLPTPQSYLIKGQGDLSLAAQVVGFPAVLKPMYGASSLAVLRIETQDELEDTYRRVIHMLKEFYAEGELMGLTFGETDYSSFESSSLSWLVLEEFIDGDEVDVDLVLKDGRVVYQVVVDDWPQIEPWFVEMGNNCPSTLPKETQEGLIDMAKRTVIDAMGFRDGVYHCELKSSSKGPRIIEINPRMGGGPVWRLHKMAFGLDLVEEHLYAALLVSGQPQVPQSPHRCASCGEKFFEKSMVVPKEFCQVVETMRLFPNVVEATPLVEPGEKIIGIQDGFPTRTARFVVIGDSPKEAQAYAKQLLEMCDIPEVIKAQQGV